MENQIAHALAQRIDALSVVAVRHSLRNVQGLAPKRLAPFRQRDHNAPLIVLVAGAGKQTRTLHPLKQRGQRAAVEIESRTQSPVSSAAAVPTTPA